MPANLTLSTEGDRLEFKFGVFFPFTHSREDKENWTWVY